MNDSFLALDARNESFTAAPAGDGGRGYGDAGAAEPGIAAEAADATAIKDAAARTYFLRGIGISLRGILADQMVKAISRFWQCIIAKIIAISEL